MSISLTISGNQSMLETFFQPPLNLEGRYECGLLYFSVFNTIPNINDTNNIFSYGEVNDQIKIPRGSYDLHDICEYLKHNVKDCELKLESNINTSTCYLFCTKPINFDVNNSVGNLLGFPGTKLEANKWHASTNPMDILPVSLIRIECDLVHGSYTNGKSSHIIYEFIPDVPPSFRFLEKPKNIIYYPITNSNISSFTIQVVDQLGDHIDFGGENIQACLHLRKIK